ncbi:MAG: glycosyltransferase family 4 protein [Nitrospiraceae bacterium]|nr:glycosyltransferase family 4 protein [Nitrospiraceae bacterium]
MLIGIDAGPLLGHGGISRYVSPLVSAFCAARGASDVELVLRRSWRQHAGLSRLRQLAPVTEVGTPDRLLTFWWEHMHSPFPAGGTLWKRFDLYLDTCLMGPVLTRGKLLAVIYDLIPLRLPALFPEHGRFREKLERLCQQADRLIAISQQTARDLTDLLQVEPARISVIYPGQSLNGAVSPSVRSRTVLNKYGITGPYMLYVGAMGPHKNVSRLVEAFETAKATGTVRAKLVLVGGTEWGRATLARIEASSVKQDIVVVGFVPDSDLPHFYAAAECFVFPSLYEGFGLPVLEAMEQGLPVLASRSGALPEVVGDAGVLVDPDDPHVWAHELVRLTHDAELRQTLGRRSREQAARFSWAHSAQQLSTLFEAVHRGVAQ